MPNMQIKYPSALKSFDQILKNAKNKKVAVFLDYDGTLSPIVDDPDRAFMSESVSMMVHFDACLWHCFGCLPLPSIKI